MQHSVKSGHLYRNAVNYKLYYVTGVFPHLKNKTTPDNLKEFIVILSEVFPDTTGNKTLDYVSLKEFELEVKGKDGEMSPRFIRIVLSEKKDNLKHLLTEFDEEETSKNNPFKKIKFLTNK